MRFWWAGVGSAVSRKREPSARITLANARLLRTLREYAETPQAEHSRRAKNLRFYRRTICNKIRGIILFSLANVFVLREIAKIKAPTKRLVLLFLVTPTRIELVLPP